MHGFSSWFLCDKIFVYINKYSNVGLKRICILRLWNAVFYINIIYVYMYICVYIYISFKPNLLVMLFKSSRAVQWLLPGALPYTSSPIPEPLSYPADVYSLLRTQLTALPSCAPGNLPWYLGWVPFQGPPSHLGLGVLALKISLWCG